MNKADNQIAKHKIGRLVEIANLRNRVAALEKQIMVHRQEAIKYQRKINSPQFVGYYKGKVYQIVYFCNLD